MEVRYIECLDVCGGLISKPVLLIKSEPQNAFFQFLKNEILEWSGLNRVEQDGKAGILHMQIEKGETPQ